MELKPNTKPLKLFHWRLKPSKGRMQIFFAPDRIS